MRIKNVFRMCSQWDFQMADDFARAQCRYKCSTLANLGPRLPASILNGSALTRPVSPTTLRRHRIYMHPLLTPN